MKYFILAFILIFNSFAIANDEVTSTEVEDNAPASFAQRCQAIEESFKGFFTNILDSSLSDLTQSTNCLSLSPVSQQDQCLPIRARIVGQLISRRGLLLEVHREVGQQWLNEKLNGPNGYMYRNCFGDRVQFQEHIRVLETTDQLSCQPFVFDWSSSLDRRVMDYLSSPPTTSQLSSNEVDELRQFLSSPIKRMLPNHAVYNQSWTEDQLREALHVVYERQRVGVEQLKRRVDTFLPHQRFRLYDFNIQYEAYLQTLSGRDRLNAQSCRDQSGFTADCIFRDFESKGRCRSRIWNGIRDLIQVKERLDNLPISPSS